MDGDLRLRHGGAGAQGLVLRRAAPQDLDSVVAVNRAAATEAYRPIFGAAPYPEDGVRRRYSNLLGDPDVHLFLAEQDGVSLGYAAARRGHLEALYVVPAAWGTGLADALYAWVAEIAGPDATLWVLRDNTRGRRFWARRGWRPTGEEDRSKAVELQYRRTDESEPPLRST